MNRTRSVLFVVALALLVAEVVRPTTIPAKRLSHPPLVRIGARLPLDQEQLEDLPPITQPMLGNIDALWVEARGKKRRFVSPGRLRGNETLVVVGWCADPEKRTQGAGLLAIVDAKRIDASDGYGSARPDVARALRGAAMANVGFVIRLRGTQMGAGDHTLQIAVVARDGRGIVIFPTIARILVIP